MACYQGLKHAEEKLMGYLRRKNIPSRCLIGSVPVICVLLSGLAVAQENPMGGNGAESFPWLLIPMFLIILGAFLFWFGRGIIGMAKCSAGSVRRRTFIGVVFPPVAEDPANYEDSARALKALRFHPWITFDVPVAVLGPDVATVVERALQRVKVDHQLKIATSVIEDNNQAGHGVDIVVKVNCEICTPSLITGTYWKQVTQTITLLPDDANESQSGAEGSRGWKPVLAQDPKWLSAKMPEIVGAALTLCGQGAEHGRI
jgi:hypothetical protein